MKPLLRTNLLAAIAALLTATASAAGLSTTFPVSAHNYTVRLTVTGARYEPVYGDEKAPDGRRFLVLEATWENLIDPAFAERRNLPAGAKADNFRDTLSLLIDGEAFAPAYVKDINLANLDPEDPDLTGHASTGATYIRQVVGVKSAQGVRSLAYYNLEKRGEKKSGDILFAAPAHDSKNLELVFHDPIGGDLRLVVAGHAVKSEDVPGAQTNPALAVAAKLSEDPAKIDDAPPAGRRYVAVELTGRSLMKVMDQLPPYDPSHEPDAQDWRSDPIDWNEFRENVHLLADGRVPCALQVREDTPSDPVFSPMIWSKFRLIYAVPREARTLDLECYFPSYTIPGVDHDVQPPPMKFHLAGPTVPPPGLPDKPEKKILDDKMEFYVVRHAALSTFGDENAEGGERFLVVDCLIHNTGSDTEEFGAAEQLVMFAADGSQIDLDSATFRGPHAPPADRFRVSPGGTYAFQVAWRASAKLARVEFGLKGNTVAEKFTLVFPSP